VQVFEDHLHQLFDGELGFVEVDAGLRACLLACALPLLS
jgi:hypothetical protein